MIAWLQRNPLILALAALAVVLLVVLGVETGFGTGLRTGMPIGPSKKAVPFEAKLLPSIAAGDAEQLYPETAARPLFIPTRRPAPEAAAPSTFQPGQFVLQGVIVVGNNRIALLREKSSGRIHRVEQGKEVSGVKVAEINREAVTLTQGNGREVLELQVQKAGAAPAAGAMAPGGPFGTAPVAGGATPAQGGNPPQPTPNAPTSPIPNMNVPPPGMNTVPPPTPPGGAPAASVSPAQAVPISPEELLARRRARRGQQSQ